MRAATPNRRTRDVRGSSRICRWAAPRGRTGCAAADRRPSCICASRSTVSHTGVVWPQLTPLHTFSNFAPAESYQPAKPAPLGTNWRLACGEPGQRGRLSVVGHQYDGLAFPVQILQDLHQLGARFTVQVAGGLFGQEERRLVLQRPGDGSKLVRDDPGASGNPFEYPLRHRAPAHRWRPRPGCTFGGRQTRTSSPVRSEGAAVWSPPSRRT